MENTSLLPRDFTKILDRINKINVGLFSESEIYYHGADEDCKNFYLLSLNQNWTKVAYEIANVISEKIVDIFKLRLGIFKHISEITEDIVSEVDNITITDEFGIEETVPNFHLQTIRKKVTNTDKIEWFKIIKKELRNYEVLLKQLNIDIASPKLKYLDENIISQIIHFEIGSEFFISHESHDSFKKLYNDPDLSEADAKLLEIKIGVTRGIAAYIIDELERTGICENIKTLIDDLKIFYNGATLLTWASLKPDKSKFVKKATDAGESKFEKKTTEKLNHADIKQSIDTHIRNITDMLDK